MPETNGEKPVLNKFDWVVPEEGVFEVYGNIFHASWSLYDIRIRVGQLVPTSPEEDARFVAEERAAVTIAWGQVKNLRDVLIDLVGRYERTNGEIKQVKLPSNEPFKP